MSLEKAGGSTLKFEVAAAGNTEVVHTMADLDLNQEIDTIRITLGAQLSNHRRYAPDHLVAFPEVIP